jgi:hypothetical protein
MKAIADVQKALQQGRSERKVETYVSVYVETLSDARTPLKGFFNHPLRKVGCCD